MLSIPLSHCGFTVRRRNNPITPPPPTNTSPQPLLSYLDGQNRGYLTVIGKARIDDKSEEKKTYWVDRFSAFFPDGPDSDEYQLMIVVPERLELRSFGLKVAEEPTRWSPVILERGTAGGWQQTN